MRYKLTLAVLAGLSMAAVAACSDDPASETDETVSDTSASVDEGDLVAAAQAEGQVVVYTGWRDASIAAVKDAFEAEYGIEVVIEERFSSAALAQRIDADIRSSGKINADFVLTTDQALASYLGEEGLSVELSAADYAGLDAGFVKDHYAVSTVGVPVVGYNKDVLGEEFEITSWDDLLDPALDGQIMIADPRGSAAWANTWSVIYNDPTLGEEFIDAIAGQNFQAVASSLVGTEQLIAGQGGVLLFGIPSLFEPAIEDGQNIDIWYPEGPAPVFFNFNLLPVEAEHPNAGVLFNQWALGEDGQGIVQSIERLASPLGQLEGTLPLPEEFTEAPAPYKVSQDVPLIVEMLGFN